MRKNLMGKQGQMADGEQEELHKEMWMFVHPFHKHLVSPCNVPGPLAGIGSRLGGK